MAYAIGYSLLLIFPGETLLKRKGQFVPDPLETLPNEPYN